jgi:Mg2+ and Co2+ transporter CorA
VSPLRLLYVAPPPGGDLGDRAPAVPDERPEAAQAALASWHEGGATVWLDAVAPSPAELETLSRTLELPALGEAVAFPAGRSTRPRPRLVHDGAFTFVRLYVPLPSALASPEDLAVPGGSTHLAPLVVCFGERLLLTVHDRPLPFLDRLAVEARTGGGGRSPAGPRDTATLLHDLLDAVIDAGTEALDDLAEAAETLEAFTYEPGARARRALQQLLRIRRDLFALRRLATAQRSALTLLARDPGALPGTPRDFEDVLDRAVRLEQAIIVQHDLLVDARAAYQSWISAGVAQVTRTLLIVTCLLSVPTLVATVYGMNFRAMPELSWPTHHLLAAAIALTLDAVLLGYFRHRGWI